MQMGDLSAFGHFLINLSDDARTHASLVDVTDGAILVDTIFVAILIGFVVIVLKVNKKILETVYQVAILIFVKVVVVI